MDSAVQAEIPSVPAIHVGGIQDATRILTEPTHGATQEMGKRRQTPGTRCRTQPVAHQPQPALDLAGSGRGTHKEKMCMAVGHGPLSPPPPQHWYIWMEFHSQVPHSVCQQHLRCRSAPRVCSNHTVGKGHFSNQGHSGASLPRVPCQHGRGPVGQGHRRHVLR